MHLCLGETQLLAPALQYVVPDSIFLLVEVLLVVRLDVDQLLVRWPMVRSLVSRCLVAVMAKHL